jgi:multiphosphoryl transfer protein
MNEVTLAAPMTGWLVSVREVPDPVFSEEMMGVGVAIDPIDGKVLAPCSAQVLLVAPTLHSVTLRTADGAELLIHVGLETVGLGGRGFRVHVKEGDNVAAGDLLIEFDMDSVALEAKSLLTPIVLTNPDAFRLTLEPMNRLVDAGQKVGAVHVLESAAGTDVSGGTSQSLQCVIAFEHGLHARPAARVADAAKRFASELTIAANGKSANARSPVALMALDVKKGDRVSLTAAGEDSGAALKAVASVLSAAEQETHRVPAAVSTSLVADDEIAGLCAVPGAAVGSAFPWRRQAAAVPETGQSPDTERAALKGAIERVCARLKSVSASIDGAGSEIAAAHIGLLEDRDLQDSALAQIEAGKSAAFAWKTATSAAAQALRATANPRMQERIADLEDITGQVISALLGQDTAAARELPEGAVVIAEDLLPSEILSLDRARLAGIAVQRGGPTSHMAIIAASLGVPTLVAMGAQLAGVPEGVSVLLDATAGKLVIDPAADATERALARSRDLESLEPHSATRDGQNVTLLANLGGVREVEAAVAAGAEGCGLLRTEFLFLDRNQAPSVEEQRAAYQAIADALGGRPLTIRTLDIGGDKPVPFIDFGHEENPALGARGVRTRLISSDLIDDQLRAIASVESHALKVMLPMVASVGELREVRKRLADLSGGKAVTLGAMVETPAAALTAERLAEEADFLSIGTNDLAQYALAMDRTNPLLAPLIDALHPAVLRLVEMTAEAGRRTGTPVSVCGNLASDPIGALLLIGFGITELSGAPATFPLVRQAVARVTVDECRELAQRAVTLESAAQVRALAADLLNRPSEGAVA